MQWLQFGCLNFCEVVGSDDELTGQASSSGITARKRKRTHSGSSHPHSRV